MSYVFVYGTLRTGQGNHERYLPSREKVCDAKLTGADLSNSKWFGVNVEGADFTDAKTDGAQGLAVSWSSAKAPPAEAPEMFPIQVIVAPILALVSLVSVVAIVLLLRRRGR